MQVVLGYSYKGLFNCQRSWDLQVRTNDLEGYFLVFNLFYLSLREFPVLFWVVLVPIPHLFTDTSPFLLTQLCALTFS